MANRCYLQVSDFEGIYPSARNKEYDDEEHAALMSAGCIPLLWLVLFEDQDLQTENLEDEEGKTEDYTAPIVLRETALARLRAKGDFLDSLFEENGGLAHHRQLFDEYLTEHSGRYVTIHLYEIEWLYEEGTFEPLLKECLTGLRTLDPAVKDPLVELSTVMPERRFITLAEANKGAYEQEDMWNYFRIMGDAWIRDVPWT